MPVSPEHKEYAQLANLVPLNTLEEDGLQALLRNVNIERLNKGDVIFQQGDVDHVNVYLLSGRVGLLSDNNQVDQVDENSATARFPIAHQLPRKFSARAMTPIQIVRIDSRVLSEALAENEARGKEHSEIVVEDEDEDWMSQLLQSRVMQNIPASNLQGVMMRMVEQEVRNGDDIIIEGDEGDFYYLLHRGQASVLKWNDDKTEQVEVARLGPGASFGEDALLSNSPRSSTIRMLSDGIVVKLGRDDFIELIQHPLSETVGYEEACKIVEGGGMWLDVRSPEDFEQSHLGDAINMPYPTLRFQIPSLSEDHHYVIVSQSGRRGIASAFLFLERGFHVSILDGGYNNVPVEQDEPDAEQTTDASDDNPEPSSGPTSSTSSASSSVSGGDDSAQVTQLQQEVERLTQQLSDKEDELAEMEIKFESLEAGGGAMTKLVAGEGADAALVKENEQLQREVISLTGQLESEETGYDKLKQQFDALSSENKKHLEIREKEIATLKEELTVLQLERDQFESDLEELEASQKIAQVAADESSETGTSEALEKAMNQISQLEALNASITNDREEMRNALENVRNELSLANQENSELKLEISELKGQIAELSGD